MNKEDTCHENRSEAMEVIYEKQDLFAIKKLLAIRKLNFKQPMIFILKPALFFSKSLNDCKHLFLPNIIVKVCYTKKVNIPRVAHS